MRVAGALIALCWAAGFAADGPIAVEKTEVADGVYVFSIGSDGYVPNGNSVVFVNADDVLVFDTYARPSTARTVLAEIRKITGKPVRYLVNSHHHPDHWSGNDVYADAFPNVEIIASEQTRELMLNIANAWPAIFTENARENEVEIKKELATGKQADGTVVSPAQQQKDAGAVERYRGFYAEAMKLRRVYPTLTYRNEMTFYHGGREFRFMSMQGDAAGTTVMYLPKEKILVTGDVISSPLPYYSFSLSQHVKSLRRLATMDAAIIIPGHGPVWRDKSYLNQEAELLESIVNQVDAAVKRGLVTAADIQKVVDVEPLRLKFTHDDEGLNAKYRRYIKGMVENATREARGGRSFD